MTKSHALSPTLFFYFFACVLIMAAMPVKSAYATTCSQVHSSLEQKFISSSFVFTGVPERSGKEVPVKVTHIYKTPKEGLPEKAQVSVGGMFSYFNGGQEYLFFGYNTEINGNVVKTRAYNECGGSDQTADDVLAALRKQKADPALPAYGVDWPVVFTGRVTQTRQWAEKRDDYPIISAVVEFEILELLRNARPKDLPKEGAVRELQESQRIKVFMVSCGDAYQVGQRYLVFALQGDPSDPDRSYRSRCLSVNKNLDEKIIVDKLSQLQK